MNRLFKRTVGFTLAISVLIADPLWASGVADALSRIRSPSSNNFTSANFTDLFLSQALGPRLEEPNPIHSEQTLAVLRAMGVFQAAKRLLHKDLVRFNVPHWWDLKHYARLFNAPLDLLLEAFKTLNHDSPEYPLVLKALSLNHNLINFQPLRDLYEILPDKSKRRDLGKVLSDIPHGTHLMKEGTRHLREIVNARAREDRNGPIFIWLVSKVKSLPKWKEGRKLLGEIYAVANGFDGSDAVRYLHANGIDNVELHASDRSLYFYQVEGMDDRYTLIFNGFGQLMQAVPKRHDVGIFWVRWTLADYMPKWYRRLVESLLRRKAHILVGREDAGRAHIAIDTLEKNFDPILQGIRKTGSKNQTIDQKIENRIVTIRPVSLLHPDAEAVAQSHPIQLEDTPFPQLAFEESDVFYPSTTQENLDFIVVNGLLKRGNEYFDDTTIKNGLVILGNRLAEGGYLLVGQVGELGKPEKVYLDIYQRVGNKLVLDHSEGHKSDKGWEQIDLKGTYGWPGKLTKHLSTSIAIAAGLLGVWYLAHMGYLDISTLQTALHRTVVLSHQLLTDPRNTLYLSGMVVSFTSFWDRRKFLKTTLLTALGLAATTQSLSAQDQQQKGPGVDISPYSRVTPQTLTNAQKVGQDADAQYQAFQKAWKFGEIDSEDLKKLVPEELPELVFRGNGKVFRKFFDYRTTLAEAYATEAVGTTLRITSDHLHEMNAAFGSGFIPDYKEMLAYPEAEVENSLARIQRLSVMGDTKFQKIKSWVLSLLGGATIATKTDIDEQKLRIYQADMKARMAWSDFVKTWIEETDKATALYYDMQRHDVAMDRWTLEMNYENRNYATERAWAVHRGISGKQAEDHGDAADKAKYKLNEERARRNEAIVEFVPLMIADLKLAQDIIDRMKAEDSTRTDLIRLPRPVMPISRAVLASHAKTAIYSDKFFNDTVRKMLSSIAPTPVEVAKAVQRVHELKKKAEILMRTKEPLTDDQEALLSDYRLANVTLKRAMAIKKIEEENHKTLGLFDSTFDFLLEAFLPDPDTENVLERSPAPTGSVLPTAVEEALTPFPKDRPSTTLIQEKVLLMQRDFLIASVLMLQDQKKNQIHLGLRVNLNLNPWLMILPYFNVKLPQDTSNIDALIDAVMSRLEEIDAELGLGTKKGIEPLRILRDFNLIVNDHDSGRENAAAAIQTLVRKTGEVVDWLKETKNWDPAYLPAMKELRIQALILQEQALVTEKAKWATQSFHANVQDTYQKKAEEKVKAVVEDVTKQPVKNLVPDVPMPQEQLKPPKIKNPKDPSKRLLLQKLMGPAGKALPMILIIGLVFIATGCNVVHTTASAPWIVEFSKSHPDLYSYLLQARFIAVEVVKAIYQWLVTAGHTPYLYDVLSKIPWWVNSTVIATLTIGTPIFYPNRMTNRKWWAQIMFAPTGAWFLYHYWHGAANVGLIYAIVIALFAYFAYPLALKYVSPKSCVRWLADKLPPRREAHSAFLLAGALFVMTYLVAGTAWSMGFVWNRLTSPSQKSVASSVAGMNLEQPVVNLYLPKDFSGDIDKVDMRHSLQAGQYAVVIKGLSPEDISEIKRDNAELESLHIPERINLGLADDTSTPGEKMRRVSEAPITIKSDESVTKLDIQDHADLLVVEDLVKNQFPLAQRDQVGNQETSKEKALRVQVVGAVDVYNMDLQRRMALDVKAEQSAEIFWGGVKVFAGQQHVTDHDPVDLFQLSNTPYVRIGLNPRPAQLFALTQALVGEDQDNIQLGFEYQGPDSSGTEYIPVKYVTDLVRNGADVPTGSNVQISHPEWGPFGQFPSYLIIHRPPDRTMPVRSQQLNFTGVYRFHGYDGQGKPIMENLVHELSTDQHVGWVTLLKPEKALDVNPPLQVSEDVKQAVQAQIDAYAREEERLRALLDENNAVATDTSGGEMSDIVKDAANTNTYINSVLPILERKRSELQKELDNMKQDGINPQTAPIPLWAGNVLMYMPNEKGVAYNTYPLERKVFSRDQKVGYTIVGPPFSINVTAYNTQEKFGNAGHIELTLPGSETPINLYRAEPMGMETMGWPFQAMTGQFQMPLSPIGSGINPVEERRLMQQLFISPDGKRVLSATSVIYRVPISEKSSPSSSLRPNVEYQILRKDSANDQYVVEIRKGQPVAPTRMDNLSNEPSLTSEPKGNVAQVNSHGTLGLTSTAVDYGEDLASVIRREWPQPTVIERLQLLWPSPKIGLGLLACIFLMVGFYKFAPLGISAFLLAGRMMIWPLVAVAFYFYTTSLPFRRKILAHKSKDKAKIDWRRPDSDHAVVYADKRPFEVDETIGIPVPSIPQLKDPRDGPRIHAELTDLHKKELLERFLEIEVYWERGKSRQFLDWQHWLKSWLPWVRRIHYNVSEMVYQSYYYDGEEISDIKALNRKYIHDTINQPKAESKTAHGNTGLKLIVLMITGFIIAPTALIDILRANWIANSLLFLLHYESTAGSIFFVDIVLVGLIGGIIYTVNKGIAEPRWLYWWSLLNWYFHFTVDYRKLPEEFKENTGYTPEEILKRYYPPEIKRSRSARSPVENVLDDVKSQEGFITSLKDFSRDIIKPWAKTLRDKPNPILLGLIAESFEDYFVRVPRAHLKQQFLSLWWPPKEKMLALVRAEHPIHENKTLYSSDVMEAMEEARQLYVLDLMEGKFDSIMHQEVYLPMLLALIMHDMTGLIPLDTSTRELVNALQERTSTLVPEVYNGHRRYRRLAQMLSFMYIVDVLLDNNYQGDPEFQDDVLSALHESFTEEDADVLEGLMKSVPGAPHFVYDAKSPLDRRVQVLRQYMTWRGALLRRDSVRLLARREMKYKVTGPDLLKNLSAEWAQHPERWLMATHLQTNDTYTTNAEILRLYSLASRINESIGKAGDKGRPAFGDLQMWRAVESILNYREGMLDFDEWAKFTSGDLKAFSFSNASDPMVGRINTNKARRLGRAASRIMVLTYRHTLEAIKEITAAGLPHSTNGRRFIMSTVEPWIWNALAKLGGLIGYLWSPFLSESMLVKLFELLPRARQEQVIRDTGLNKAQQDSLKDAIKLHDWLLRRVGLGFAVVDDWRESRRWLMGTGKPAIVFFMPDAKNRPENIPSGSVPDILGAILPRPNQAAGYGTTGPIHQRSFGEILLSWFGRWVPSWGSARANPHQRHAPALDRAA